MDCRNSSYCFPSVQSFDRICELVLRSMEFLQLNDQSITIYLRFIFVIQIHQRHNLEYHQSSSQLWTIINYSSVNLLVKVYFQIVSHTIKLCFITASAHKLITHRRNLLSNQIVKQEVWYKHEQNKNYQVFTGMYTSMNCQ